MPLHEVSLRKTYCNETFEIDGHIKIEAESQAEAEEIVENMIQLIRFGTCDNDKAKELGKLKSTDKRIEWLDEPDESWIYDDFSFEVVYDNE